MAGRLGFGIQALLAALLIINQNARPCEGSTEPGVRTGLLTDRLTAKKLRIWRSIEQIALAQDSAGQPLHPKLYHLYNQVQTSGHMIHIEMPVSKDASKFGCLQMGVFLVEKLDPTGRRHMLVIRLYPSTIDRALVAKMVRSAEEFMAFQGLTRRQRCAEVLGHELGHIVQWLADPEYRRLEVGLRELASKTFELHREKRKGQSFQQEKRQQVEKLLLLSGEMEKPALAAEQEVWRELLRGREAQSMASR